MNVYDNKIIVRNSCIIVTNYNLGDSPRLENQFRIFNMVTHECNYFGLHYDEENKLLFIPRGIDIWFVENCIGTKAYIDTNYDEFAYTDSFKLKTKPRDDVQKQALKFTVGVGDYSDNKYKSQLMLSLVTGKGKTYISIATMAYYEIKSIIITYSITWLNQWKERILDYTGIHEKEICYINGSASIARLLHTDASRYKVFLVSHATLQSYASENGWEKVGEFFRYLKIGLKFFDEAHLNFENMCMIDFYTNTYKTFYVTASPARSDREENEIYAKYFKNIPVIDLFDDDEDPHTKYVAIKYNSNPSPFDIHDCKNMYGLDRNKYIDYLIKKPEYEYILSVVLDLAMKQSGKVLIYIGTNKAILYTYNLIRAKYPELYDQVGIFTTAVSKEEKEENKNKRIILSTTKSAGAAVDIQGLKMTIVLDEPFKSHVTAQQSLGRTRADNTYYIDCIDIGFMHLKKYYAYKKPIFEKYALSCSEANISNMELKARYDNITNKRKNSIPLFTTPLLTYID